MLNVMTIALVIGWVAVAALIIIMATSYRTLPTLK
jgi:hypothetical protein